MQQQMMPEVRTAKPFLKWVGGKQQLIEQFQPLFPVSVRRYHEPFLGGGAVYFHLWDTGRILESAWLADTNAELVGAYLAVRDQVDEVLLALTQHEARHCRSYYYEIRALDRQSNDLTNIDRAARMIYLNRTCYNGLYRVNRQGHFNVPMGSYKDPKIVFEETLRAASAALKTAQLRVGSFETVLEYAQPGDFVYFDPPYDPVSKTASFTSYTNSSFGDQEQRRLADIFIELARRGCYCMLSNSHTEFILGLYGDFRIELVRATRAVNSNGHARGAINEVVVLNY